MKIEITTIKKCQNFYLPDGEYSGWWSGYEITIKWGDDSDVTIKTKSGIRGWTNVKVIVKDGIVEIQ
jgi:hypothetical protein